MLFVLRPRPAGPLVALQPGGWHFPDVSPMEAHHRLPAFVFPATRCHTALGTGCGGKSAHTLPRAAAQSPEGSRDPAPYPHSTWHQGGPRDGRLCSNMGAARGPILAALYGPTPTFWKERVSHIRFGADPGRSLPSPSCLPPPAFVVPCPAPVPTPCQASAAWCPATPPGAQGRGRTERAKPQGGGVQTAGSSSLPSWLPRVSEGRPRVQCTSPAASQALLMSSESFCPPKVIKAPSLKGRDAGLDSSDMKWDGVVPAA